MNQACHKKKRLKLKYIAETDFLVLSLLRGHSDDFPAVEGSSCTNHGNFLALLQFRIQAGDHVLKGAVSHVVEIKWSKFTLFFFYEIGIVFLKHHI